MEYIVEKEKRIPVSHKVDVLVVGGGPAGFGAAVWAAREGANTLLIEQTGDVGGVATTGLMSHWTGHTQGGFYEEVLDRTSQCSGNGPDGFDCDMRQVINPEFLKTKMLEMLVESGAGLQLYTSACEAVMGEGGEIKGVIVQSKSGREAILAKIVIDASGDGDIAASSGAPYYKGRENDGKMQPMTIMFKVAGVDVDRAVFPSGFEDTYQLPCGDLQTLGREQLPAPTGHVLLYKSTLPGIVTCNMTNCVDVDGTNVRDLTKATLLCREQMEVIVDFLRRNVPGFENCFIISSASYIGVRETRHFKGEACITEKDIVAARIFDDWAVTKAHFNFDVHCVDGSGLDPTGAQKKFPQQKGYTIPYGCFIPLETENLLLAGRNISGTHMAHSNFRVMPICLNMGQSVGIAAAMCVKDETTPRSLDVSQLQCRLKEVGVEP